MFLHGNRVACLCFNDGSTIDRTPAKGCYMQKTKKKCDRADGLIRNRLHFDSEPWQIASKLIFINALLIGLPTILCYYNLALGSGSLTWLHYSLVALYLTSAAMVIAESTAAVWRRFAEPSRLQWIRQSPWPRW